MKNDEADDVGTTELELDRRGYFLRQLKRPEEAEEKEEDEDAADGNAGAVEL